MKYTALIVEPSRLFQNIIKQIMEESGVQCCIYSTAHDALESTHNEYTFIIISRTLPDITGEIFLSLLGVKHGLGNAHTILLTTSKDDLIINEALESGYHSVLNRDDISTLATLTLNHIQSKKLNLSANILLIEDSLAIAETILLLFRENKSVIHHVKCIQEMKISFDVHDYDLVISDYYLGASDTGDDAILHIQNHTNQEKSNTPILILSSEQDSNKKISFLTKGANDCITKPFNHDELLVRSSNLIRTYKLYKQSKEQQNQLIKLALTDHLTGLYNRHSLYDIGPKYISSALRHQSDLSLLVIDLDFFKRINDTQGHIVGDIVLKSIASVLQKSCRSEDMVARFGGEEFILLLTGCNIENARQKAELIRQNIEQTKPEGIPVTASIGVSDLQEKDDFNTLFDRADKAVYEAKSSGRNKVVLFVNVHDPRT